MRWLVGLLLLAAALLKAYQLMFAASVAALSTVDRSLLFLQVVLEYGLALVVLGGFYWRQVRWGVLVVFVGFAAYSLFLATTGAASCGCFGPVKVSPWWTFAIDAAIASGLLSSILSNDRNTSSVEVGPPTANRLLVAGALFLVPIISLSVIALAGHERTLAGPIQQVGNLTILEPEEWIGQAFPIAAFIDLDLSHGRWTVLLHRHDCPQCRQEMPRYEQLASIEQVALVEVPPFGDFINLHGGPAAFGRLSDGREWFVQTPVEIVLEDGIVVAASKYHE